MNILKSVVLGKEEETIVLPILQKYFNDNTIQPTKSQYDRFDFESKTKRIELKRRYVFKNTYRDTMIGCNKINEAAANYQERDYYFVFKFNDCLAFWKYDPSIVLERRQGGRVDRGMNEIKQYCFIPTDILTTINI